jgi:hypothetical protein
MPIFRSTPYDIITTQLLSATATDTQTIATEGHSDMLLLVTYITGAAETNNIINIGIKTSSGARNTTTGRKTESDKYVLVNGADSSGVVTLSNVTLKYTGASAATTYKIAFPIQLQDDFVTFSVLEEGVAANFGTVSLKCVLVNKYQ